LVDNILEAGLTEEDAKLLADMNWMIEDECGDYLACFA
jgi:hypothetical protein